MQVGIKVVHCQLPDTVTQAEVESAVRTTCSDESIDGILVQVGKPACVDTEGAVSKHVTSVRVTAAAAATASGRSSSHSRS